MLTDRAARVYAILRCLLEWVPGPPATSPRTDPGFGPAGSRWATCPDCLANGRVLFTCETCGGRGEVFEGGRDPMSDPPAVPRDHRRRAAGFGGSDREDARDRRRRLLDIERRLGEDADVRAGRIAPADRETRAIDARDRLYARGSVSDVARALERLRDVDVDAYRACYSIALDPPAADVELDTRHPAGVELLAALVPDPVLVPAGMLQAPDVERIARAGRAALWRGRNGWAARTRGERDALVRAAIVEGVSISTVSLRFGLSRRRVQQIVAASPASTADPLPRAVSGSSRARCGL